MTKLIYARDLEPGHSVRLTSGRIGTVRSAQYEDGQLIVGGEYNKTATALRVTTVDGESFLVHPGQSLTGV